MNLFKKLHLRQASFGQELFVIMLPAVLYVIAAYASLRFAHIFTPDVAFTDRAIQRLKSDDSNGEYKVSPKQAAERLGNSWRARDALLADAAKTLRFLAVGIIIPLIFQIYIVVRVYYTRKPKNAGQIENQQTSSPPQIT
ncbi:MAG TPA: hypothetical protein VFB72_14610 [Verrucomicrobiae bacterium]|nr:hypothetical protein [Verrucomicrobiae bacterium]